MVRKRFLIHRSGCAVCGDPLNYKTTFQSFNCYYCDTVKESEISCASGHFVCDDCHRIDANDFITKTCLQYTGQNPIELANIIMNDRVVNLHGPEHHYLVPAILITCYRNNTDRQKNLKFDLETLKTRMVKIPGDICALYGGCGAILGLGSFISHVTGTTALSGKEWAHVHSITGAGFMHVSKYGGPRCCKRNTYIALLEGMNWLKEFKEINLVRSETIECCFSDNNNECLKHKCLFYGKQIAS